MARTPDMQSLVASFAADLEAMVQQRVTEQVAQRMDELRGDILGGRTPSARGGRTARAGRPGPRVGYAAAEKPCPICGEKNKARRFSFLCDKHRTAENLAKFKGSSRQPAGGEESASQAKGAQGGGRKKAGRPAKTSARKAAGRGGRKAGKGGKGKGEKAGESAATEA